LHYELTDILILYALHQSNSTNILSRKQDQEYLDTISILIEK